MKILVINAGSSSLKYQLIDMDDESVKAKGLVERIGIAGSNLVHKYGVDCGGVFDMIASRYLDIQHELGLELDRVQQLEQNRNLELDRDQELELHHPV